MKNIKTKLIAVTALRVVTKPYDYIDLMANPNALRKTEIRVLLNGLIH